MQVEWPETRFKDLLSEPVRNGIYKKKEFHGRGARIVNMGELFGHPRLFDTEMKRVELTKKEKQKVLLENGDLLFARRSLTAEGAGKCSIVKEVPEETTFESSIIRARPDPEKADSDFLYYFFSSPNGKYLIGTILRQVAVSGITGSDLKELPIPTPSVREQKAIAHILGTLDEKIELNRRINATLETMAQALFKSWFVDFDPIIDNALAAGNPIPEPLQARFEARKALGDQRKPLPEAIQNQFPNGFVFNDDLGWVPEGWDVGVFGNIAEHVKDNVKAEEVGDFDFYVGLEHIGRKELFLSENASGESIESNKSRFTEKDLLFGKLRPYFHKVCLAPQDGICSTDILIFRSKDVFLHSFMALTAYRDEFVEYANLRSTGTRMPRASAKDMLNFPIVIPAAEVAEDFENRVASLWEKGMLNVGESYDLAKIRDTLLPKLLSGQLRIPEAERQAAQAT